MTACEQVLHLGVRTTLQGASEVSRNGNAGENVKAARLLLFSFSAHLSRFTFGVPLTHDFQRYPHLAKSN